MTRKDGRWGLSTKTLCAACGQPIGKASHSCPGPAFAPVHFRCAYPEMAVTHDNEEAAS